MREAQLVLNLQLLAAPGPWSGGAASAMLCARLCSKQADGNTFSDARGQQGIQLGSSFITSAQRREIHWCYQTRAEFELQPAGNVSSHWQLEHPCLLPPELPLHVCVGSENGASCGDWYFYMQDNVENGYF